MAVTLSAKTVAFAKAQGARPGVVATRIASAQYGVRIELDGVEVKELRSAHLSMPLGGLAQLTLNTFVQAPLLIEIPACVTVLLEPIVGHVLQVTHKRRDDGTEYLEYQAFVAGQEPR